MSGTLLLALALTAPPQAGSAGADAAPDKPLDKQTARNLYKHLLRNTTQRDPARARYAVPALVDLYRRIDDVPRMAPSEKHRLKAGLQQRMEFYAERLRPAAVRHRRAAQRSRTRTRSRTRARSTARASQPGPQADRRAYELIALIQQVVKPRIWNVNGGPASIGYFRPYHALIIRAPGEVHYQLGGTLQQVRRAR